MFVAIIYSQGDGSYSSVAMRGVPQRDHYNMMYHHMRAQEVLNHGARHPYVPRYVTKSDSKTKKKHGQSVNPVQFIIVCFFLFLTLSFSHSCTSHIHILSHLFPSPPVCCTHRTMERNISFHFF